MPRAPIPSTNSTKCWAIAGTAGTSIIKSTANTLPRWIARIARASTIASAIEINRPVNYEKCLRALDVCNGVVREVTDQQILDAKAQVGASGLGCEPASAASVAGAKLLRAKRE